MGRYSLFAPLYRKQIKKAEKEAGRDLSKLEKRNIIDEYGKKIRRGAAIGGTVAALAAASIAGIHISKNVKCLPEPEKQVTQEDNSSNTYATNSKTPTYVSKVKTFKDSIKVDQSQLTAITPKKGENNLVQEILDDYNKRYETDLKLNEISYIKSDPQFITVDKNGNYVYDYRENTEASEYITDKNKIDSVYIIVNKKEDSIISAIGKINEAIVNVKAKQAKVGYTEYFESDKTIDLTFDEHGDKKSKKEITRVYKEISKAYEQKVNEKDDDLEKG